MKRLLSIFLALGTFSLYAGQYSLDMSHSQIGFSVKHMMVSKVKGKFDFYEGEIEFDEKSMQFTKLKGVVDSESINTDNETRDDHLRSEDFFAVDKYPEITFEMTGYKGDEEEGKMDGLLTIRGVTKPVTLEVEIGGVVTDFQGKQRIGFSMEGKIDRQDFGLKWNKLLETGGLVVGDTVKLQIDIEAIERK
ncbi:MAG: YceI family protein [Sulfurimonadaceae bacterium]|nr:YceI family protein [Sulfurimonadaceae bacterium]